MNWLIILPFLGLLAYCGTINGRNKGLYIGNIAIGSKILLILALSLMVGFWGISAQDHSAYLRMYNNFESVDTFRKAIVAIYNSAFSGDRLEFGYALVNIIGNLIGLKPPAFLLLVYLFINVSVVKFIYRYPHPVLALFLAFSMTFFFQEANLVRQFMAMAVFLFAIPLLLEGKWIKYLILIFIAYLFHRSAIVLGVFVIYNFINRNKLNAIAYNGINLFWGISVLMLTGVISLNLMGYFSIFDEYSMYLTDENTVGTESSLQNIIFHNILFVILYISIKRKPINKFLLFYLIFVFAVAIINISVVFPNLFRFSKYFVITSYVFAIYMISNLKQWGYNRYNVLIVALQLYCILKLLFVYVFNENVFGTKSYTWSQFF